MSPSEALAAIVAAADRVASKWQQIRAANSDSADWDDFSFYKGNARWANGASVDLGGLQAADFADAHSACDAAEAMVNRRGWDPDYDEPTAARGEIQAAIEEVRLRLGDRGGFRRRAARPGLRRSGR